MVHPHPASAAYVDPANGTKFRRYVIHARDRKSSAKRRRPSSDDGGTRDGIEGADGPLPSASPPRKRRRRAARTVSRRDPPEAASESSSSSSPSSPSPSSSSSSSTSPSSSSSSTSPSSSSSRGVGLALRSYLHPRSTIGEVDSGMRLFGLRKFRRRRTAGRVATRLRRWRRRCAVSRTRAKSSSGTVDATGERPRGAVDAMSPGKPRTVRGTERRADDGIFAPI